MELKIEKLVYGGDGLARTDAGDQGKRATVFLPFVLPGSGNKNLFHPDIPFFSHPGP